MAAMGPQIYTRRDVRRLMAALGIFVGVPCVLLLFLGWQSLQSLHRLGITFRHGAQSPGLGHNLRTVAAP